MSKPRGSAAKPKCLLCTAFYKQENGDEYCNGCKKALKKLIIEEKERSRIIP